MDQVVILNEPHHLGDQACAAKHLGFQLDVQEQLAANLDDDLLQGGDALASESAAS